jgi:hypothetical protein
MVPFSRFAGEGTGILEWTPPFSDGIEVPKWESLEDFPKLKEASP